ncbi:tetratricopeptide repeat protein 22-like [Strongylocentrotus purpuratus]|uniref:TIR domain-containing protein n=1 Tax=Strongylocentrotus purpuratus TaxID=7668 RepID=A0A7M7N094_STRPU|nr:tetratricopeptide repeat protein 22-like [Strongylocentrotus purpuratus]
MACASLIDSISDVDNPLGLLGLTLAFNGGNLNGKQEAQARRKLNRRLPLLERELADRPIRHGNRNYVGMLYYILQEKDKAIECWEKTVEEDPTNLNAIKDLCTAYAKLGDRKESRKWQSRLEETQSKLSGNPDDEKRVYARCRAEQAFAACWDLHTQTWSKGVTAMEETVQKFESALEYADKLISQDEKEDWHLAIGQAYERLSHRHKRSNNIPQYICAINMAAQYLHFSISSSQHTMHKAEAWGVLGNALTYDSNDTPASIPSFIETKYKAYWYEPSLCYDQALSLDPGNAWLLGNYGHLLRKLGYYSAAMEKLDKSIESDQSPSSWFSYDNRSKVYKQLARNTADKQVRERFLRRAAEDSKMADISNPNPRSQSQRGQIAHDMAESSGTNQEKKHYSVQALAHFAESLQIQDGMDISDAHLKQGQCLLKRDKWSAVQSFKMAYSTSPPNDFQETIASKYLLPNLLDHYQKEQKPENLLAELAYWITNASVRHQSMSSIFKILGKLARNRFQNEILEVMEYIVVYQPTVLGVDRMIDEGFIALRKTTFRRENFKRLCNLERQHTTKMHSSTSLDPTTPLPHHQPPEKAKNPKWQNDFYVITPVESTQWVQYFLLPGMECNFFSLKGFYQQRDQVIGKLKVRSQAEAISNSASIVIVYSGSFSDDEECMRLFGAACETRPAPQMALLKLDNTPIAPQMARITQFDFSGSQTQVPPQWFDLAKFLS